MKTSNRKRIRRAVGDFVKIRLDDKSHSYARVLEEPLFAFYNCVVSEDLAVDEIRQYPVLFKIWVMNRAVTSGRWSVVGNRPLEKAEQESPAFFKQDAFKPDAFFVYRNGVERSASYAECEGLECAAVWDPEHVEDRLRDHFAGKPNKWVKSLKPRKPT